MTQTKAERMSWGDYIVVCIRQMLEGARDGRPMPEDFLALFPDYEGYCGTTPEEYRDGMSLADELFGRSQYAGTGERLFEVETLTLKESAIACRMDLTHAEKIELIRPLREKREAASDAVQERLSRRPSVYELRDQEKRRQREEKREEQIAAAVAESVVVSQDDRAWAAQLGISLD